MWLQQINYSESEVIRLDADADGLAYLPVNVMSSDLEKLPSTGVLASVLSNPSPPSGECFTKCKVHH